jgi:hypothetical protein
MFDQFESIEAVQLGISEEPIRVLILESGWKTSPAMYHVLEEHGDREQTDYHFLSADQISTRYGVNYPKHTAAKVS